MPVDAMAEIGGNMSSSTSKEKFECKDCPKSFLLNESLERHIKRNHTGGEGIAMSDPSRITIAPAMSTQPTKNKLPLPRIINSRNVSGDQDGDISTAKLNTLPKVGIAKKQIERDISFSGSEKLPIPDLIAPIIPSKYVGTAQSSKKHNSDDLATNENAKKIKTTFRSGIQCLYCPFNHPSINAVRAHIKCAHSRQIERNKTGNDSKGISVETGTGLSKAQEFTLRCTKDRNCTFKTNSLKVLRDHFSSKHLKALFSCPLCIKRYNRHPDLTKHILMDHSGIPKYEKSIFSKRPNEHCNIISTPQDGFSSVSNSKLYHSPSNTKEAYPFDFDGLKAYLKMYVSVKHIVETSNDPQLIAEILEKDKYNLLRYKNSLDIPTLNSNKSQCKMGIDTALNTFTNGANEESSNSPELEVLETGSTSKISNDCCISILDESPEKLFESRDDQKTSTPNKIFKRMTGKEFRSSRRAITPVSEIEDK